MLGSEAPRYSPTKTMKRCLRSLLAFGLRFLLAVADFGSPSSPSASSRFRFFDAFTLAFVVSLTFFFAGETGAASPSSRSCSGTSIGSASTALPLPLRAPERCASAFCCFFVSFGAASVDIVTVWEEADPWQDWRVWKYCCLAFDRLARNAVLPECTLPLRITRKMSAALSRRLASLSLGAGPSTFSCSCKGPSQQAKTLQHSQAELFRYQSHRLLRSL